MALRNLSASGDAGTINWLIIPALKRMKISASSSPVRTIGCLDIQKPTLLTLMLYIATQWATSSCEYQQQRLRLDNQDSV